MATCRMKIIGKRSHAEFKKVDLDARQDLYRRLTEQILDPERPVQEAVS